MMEKNQRQADLVASRAMRTKPRRFDSSREKRVNRHPWGSRWLMWTVFTVVTIVTVTVNVAVFVASSVAAVAATLEAQEQTALELKVELSRLGSAGDPLEREALLLRIARECPDVEEGQTAYWALSNLYLDDFDDPDERRAREILERFLENYPSSRWTTQVKCRLLTLCEREDATRANQLRADLLKSGQLPNMIRNMMH